MRDASSGDKTLYKKNLCIKLVNYYGYTEMHGQQNVKISDTCIRAYAKHICFLVHNISSPVSETDTTQTHNISII